MRQVPRRAFAVFLAARRAVALQPRNALPHLFLAQALLDGGDEARALSEFRAAAALDPKLRADMMPDGPLGGLAERLEAKEAAGPAEP